MDERLISFQQFWRAAQRGIKGTRKERRQKARAYYREYLKRIKCPTGTKKGGD